MKDMASQYRCTNCNKAFDKYTHDGFCDMPPCYGVGLLQEIPAGSAGAADGTPMEASEIGLCILVCDASGSMDRTAFAGNPASRARLVAAAAAGALNELSA